MSDHCGVRGGFDLLGGIPDFSSENAHCSVTFHLSVSTCIVQINRPSWSLSGIYWCSLCPVFVCGGCKLSGLGFFFF